MGFVADRSAPLLGSPLSPQWAMPLSLVVAQSTCRSQYATAGSAIAISMGTTNRGRMLPAPLSPVVAQSTRRSQYATAGSVIAISMDTTNGGSMAHASVDTKTDVDGALALIEEVKAMLMKMMVVEEGTRAALHAALTLSACLDALRSPPCRIWGGAALMLCSLLPFPWALAPQPRLTVAQCSPLWPSSSPSPRAAPLSPAVVWYSCSTADPNGRGCCSLHRPHWHRQLRHPWHAPSQLILLCHPWFLHHHPHG
jgi:hypothetical protein